MSQTNRAAGRPKNPISRQLLLEGAAQVFARDGYRGARLDDIAAAGGIRKASLLSRFGSKQQLYLEVLSTVLSQLGALLADALAQPGPFLERLDRLGALLTDTFGTHPAWAPLLMREVIDQGPFAAEAGQALIDATLAGVADLLRAGMAEGAIAPGDPDHLALSIVGLHLTWFASPAASSRRIGMDISDPRAVQRRRDEVTTQVRRLCGADPG